MKQTNVSIGATSATVLAEDAEKHLDYILIQNTHPSQILYVRLDGATATAANGIKISAGESYEHHYANPTQNDITAIASGASTTVIVAYELS